MKSLIIVHRNSVSFETIDDIQITIEKTEELNPNPSGRIDFT